MTIDGYTQPGSQPNTAMLGPLDTIIRIELQATSPAVGNGLRIEASNVAVRGLAIANFTTNISVSDTSTAVSIGGNFIGTAADGLTAMGSINGVACDLCAGLTIGGGSEAERNLISGNSGAGVRTARPAGSTSVILTIRGNLIGPNKTVTGALPSGIGIYLHTPSNASAAGDRVAIGGALNPWESNMIAGNTSHGIAIQRDAGSDPSGAQLSIFSNSIGTDDMNTVQMGNGGDGVMISGAVRGSMIFNSVAYNGGRGIVVAGPLTTNGHGIQLRNGRITGNGGLAIDIGNDGRTPNDADDSDDGANALLNFPVLTEAGVDGSSGLLQFAGTVQARPNMMYLIEFFKIPAAVNRPNGYEAPALLHSASITTNASGAATFSYTKANGGAVGDKIVAMLHDTSVRSHSSEISDPLAVTLSLPAITGKITREGGTVVKNVTVQLSGTQSATTVTDSSGNYVFTNLPAGGNYTVTPLDPGYTYTPATRSYTNLTVSQTANFSGASIPATYTVNVTHDAGDGSCSPSECTLREAIATANDHPGADTISFAIAGSGPHTLVVDSLLPNLASDLVIDGDTQPGAFVNTKATGGLNSVLKIALAPGALSSPGAHALQILGSRVTIRGLAIAGFPIGIFVPQNRRTPSPASSSPATIWARRRTGSPRPPTARAASSPSAEPDSPSAARRPRRAT